MHEKSKEKDRKKKKNKGTKGHGSYYSVQQ